MSAHTTRTTGIRYGFYWEDMIRFITGAERLIPVVSPVGDPKKRVMERIPGVSYEMARQEWVAWVRNIINDEELTRSHRELQEKVVYEILDYLKLCMTLPFRGYTGYKGDKTIARRGEKYRKRQETFPLWPWYSVPDFDSIPDPDFYFHFDQ